MDDGFIFMVKTDSGGVDQISIPMDRMKGFVDVIGLLSNLGGPDVWMELNTFQIDECVAVRVRDGKPAYG